MNLETNTRSKFPTGTLIFGLILVLVATAQLTRHIFSWSFDAPLFFITLIALAGIALILSGVASARRAAAKKNSPPPTDSNRF